MFLTDLCSSYISEQCLYLMKIHSTKGRHGNFFSQLNNSALILLKKSISNVYLKLEHKTDSLLMANYLTRGIQWNFCKWVDFLACFMYINGYQLYLNHIWGRIGQFPPRPLFLLLGNGSVIRTYCILWNVNIWMKKYIHVNMSECN